MTPKICQIKLIPAEPTVSTQTYSHDTITTISVETNIFNSLINERFPTDEVHFKEPFNRQK